MSSSSPIVHILWRYKNHEDLTDAELSELREWLEKSPDNENLFDDLSNAAKWEKGIDPLLDKDSNATWKKIKERIEALETPKIEERLSWRRYAAAVAILIILFGAGLLLIINKKAAKNNISVSSKDSLKNEVYPVLNNARLTLDNGTVVSLDSAKKGEIAVQGRTWISKADSNVLNYNVYSSGISELKYNTLEIGKGSIFKLTLPDGSLAWLNSGTNLRFPVAFVGNIRSVELTGEAYFEIEKNIEKPFIVKTAYSDIRVLGTHFNVNAYDDEHLMKTTLLEGSVMVRRGNDSVFIKPGQQVKVSNSGPFQIDSANIQQVMAWRSRLFWFQRTPFNEIMLRISRQYDVEVSYEEPVKNSFTGILPQNLPLSSLLNMLEKGGNVHFTIEGQKIIVKQ